MANNEKYQELINLPAVKKLDSYTLFALAREVAQNKDADEIAMPMLAELRSNASMEFPEGVRILFNMDGIIGLCATPGQLIELLQNDNIVRYEASRPGGSL